MNSLNEFVEVLVNSFIKYVGHTKSLKWSGYLIRAAVQFRSSVVVDGVYSLTYPPPPPQTPLMIVGQNERQILSKWIMSWRSICGCKKKTILSKIYCLMLNKRYQSSGNKILTNKSKTKNTHNTR